MEYGKQRQHGTSKTGRPRMRCWNDVTIQRKNGSRGRRNDLATHKVVVMMINMNANCFNAASIPSANNSECIHLNKTKQNKSQFTLWAYPGTFCLDISALC
jgi:hypothetical protein